MTEDVTLFDRYEEVTEEKKNSFLNTFGSYLFFVYIYRHECSVFGVIYMHDLLFSGLGYGCR